MPETLAASDFDTKSQCAALRSGLNRVSTQFNLIVDALSEEQYSRSFGRTSIGSHARHAIEFMEMLLSGLETRKIHYDSSVRNAAYEKDPEVARAAMNNVVERLSGAVDTLMPEYALTVYHTAEEGAPPVAVPSSLGRETISVTEHAIHHFAMINAMGLFLLEIAFDPQVGMSAATNVYQQKRMG